eukprot:768716-Hanusia_phi.AAC.6
MTGEVCEENPSPWPELSALADLLFSPSSRAIEHAGHAAEDNQSRSDMRGRDSQSSPSRSLVLSSQ